MFITMTKDPSIAKNTSIRALSPSLVPISVKTVSKAAIIFPPVKISPPAIIPIKREVITSLVISAKAMATIGGIIDKNPNSIFSPLLFIFFFSLIFPVNIHYFRENIRA